MEDIPRENSKFKGKETRMSTGGSNCSGLLEYKLGGREKREMRLGWGGGRGVSKALSCRISPVRY